MMATGITGEIYDRLPSPSLDGISEATKAVSSKSSSLREHAKSLADKKKLRRGKRQVIFEDAINADNDDDDEFTEEALLRQQLQQLSDNELAALADIVRGEMIRYELPRMVAVPQYEIIEVPNEMLEQTVLEPFPRDRRAAPMDWGDEAEEAEFVVVPEEAVMEALNDEQDELELRERIAEIAQILNERATRRARFF